MYGVNGKILHVDLSTEKIWTEEYDENLLKKFLGSRGIQAKLLWEYTDENTDPLSSENVLIIGTGVLTGTTAPSAGRTTLTFKSPATGLYGKSSVGGGFGIHLKLAGYDILVVHGKAEKPVYLYIDNNTVEIKSAADLWGKDVRETYTTLIRKHGHDGDALVIGPAGENLVKFAAIMASVYNAAARAGVGAVMGSKNLKAIFAKGKGTIEVADPDEFYDLVTLARERIKRDEALQSTAEFGTSGSTLTLNETYSLPVKNFQQNHLEEAYKYSGSYLIDKGYLKGRVGCGTCPISCHRHTRLETGRYAGTDTVGPEYETFNAFGPGCMLEPEAVIKANDLCNIYGMDTISAGGVIQWAMESYEKGVITKEMADGLELTWGNDKAVMELLRKIAYREGFGDILAEGTKGASEKIGGDSWKWAVQAKGLEHSRVDTRQMKAYALAFAVNPRGPDHLHTETFAEFGTTEDARRVIEKIAGDRKYARPGITDKRPEIVRWHEDIYAATECMGLCVFLTTAGFAIDEELMARMFTAATGIPMTVEELMTAGRRIVTLERAYNVRLGYSREMDILPWRIMNEPVKTPEREQQVTSKEELDKMLDRYYELHEWDPVTGRPTVKTLQKLGLEDVAEELQKKGLIK